MADRPNLIFIMPDQLRHDFLGCYGASFISTPHIDRLAAERARATTGPTACIRVACRRGRRCQHLVGFLQGGWMAFDGRFKLCKYSSGFQALFDLESDPQEQDNLVDAAEHATDYRRLDILLCREIMRSTQAANAYNEVFIPQQDDLWTSREFGRSGWQRTYPKSLED